MNRRLPELPGPGRLGRHVGHDPRSRAFAAEPLAPRTVRHRHYGPVLDQGQLGSCTGNALAQALNTGPLHRRGEPLLREKDAVALYSAATALDPFPGAWPPEDTGSDGNSVCKAARDAGRLSGWRHAFGLEQGLGALGEQPVIVGTLWTEGMDTPDGDGFLNPQSGAVRGGHEYLLLGCDARRETVTMLNSWGAGWAASGRARLRWADLGWLLDREGDLTVPLR